MYPPLSQAMIFADDPAETAAAALTSILGNAEVVDAAMAGFGCLALVAALAIGTVIYVFGIYCHWRICSKAGYSGALSLLMLIPLLGSIILLLVLAFGKWPVNRNRQETRESKE